MSRLFWIWWLYSFFGYLLEKAFAAATHARQRNRKCFIVLPLCPVYGVAMLAIFLLPPVWREGWRLVLTAAAVPCAAEYLLHLYYEKLFHVRYWDYRGVPLNLGGRVCLAFAAAWVALVLPAVTLLQPALEGLIAAIPPWGTFAAWMALTADLLCSRQLLRRCRDTERLSLRALREAE